MVFEDVGTKKYSAREKSVRCYGGYLLGICFGRRSRRYLRRTFSSLGNFEIPKSGH